MTDKKYFKIVLFTVCLLFLTTSFSVVYCIVKASSVPETQNSSHIMSIVYLIFHLLMEAVAFYYSFKAMVNASSLMKAAMYVKDGQVNKKSRRNALIIMIISSLLAIYFFLTILPIDIFLSFFALGLRFALLNFFILVAVLSIFFFCYKNVPEEK